ncbi:MAG: prepilin-type N-terminal cleavage/methylation domain-containing protein [Chloroflexi bacterium]|nr:prepilin-type N-terminal cleavage/methylation domain-containing protein [Chloroflexota bacterium]
MMFGRLGVIQRDQRGLTLVELLIAILLAGVVTGGITMTIFQVFNMNSRTSNHMVAIRQVQHAGKQVSQDLLQAKHIDTENNPATPELLTLTWTDWDDARHEIVYTLEDMPSGEFKILRREHKIDSVTDSTINVAEYIDPAETNCCYDCNGDGYCDCYDDCNCNAIIFTVTANVGGQSETRIYEVMPRSGSQ